MSGLGNRVDCSSQVDPTLRVVKVRQFTVLVNENRDFTKKMRATELAVCLVNLHVKLHASTAEELEALDLSETESVKGHKSEAHLQDDVLHGVI